MANKYKETNWKLKKRLLKEMKTKYCLFIDGSIENLNGKQLAGFASFIYNRMGEDWCNKNIELEWSVELNTLALYIVARHFKDKTVLSAPFIENSIGEAVALLGHEKYANTIIKTLYNNKRIKPLSLSRLVAGVRYAIVSNKTFIFLNDKNKLENEYIDDLFAEILSKCDIEFHTRWITICLKDGRISKAITHFDMLPYLINFNKVDFAKFEVDWTHELKSGLIDKQFYEEKLVEQDKKSYLKMRVV